MEPEFVGGNVRVECPDCSAVCTFEYKHASSNVEYGTILIQKSHQYNGETYGRIIYKLLKCSSCDRPGVAKLHSKNKYRTESALESFWPNSLQNLQISKNVPEEIEKEFREAELCMSVNAWRGAAALFRSALEKTLIANGYDDRDLYSKIETAGTDGVITSARRQRAQDLVRTMGNDVLHGEWRDVLKEEVEDAHLYVARIIEDFYDDRETVSKVLNQKGRMKSGS